MKKNRKNLPGLKVKETGIKAGMGVDPTNHNRNLLK